MSANLKYHWKAIKNDDSEIVQIDGETENPYSDVMTELSSENVKEFQLIEQDEDTPRVYCVDLVNYKFYSGTTSSPHENDDTPGGISGTGRADLIFWRRNQVRVNEHGEVVEPARTTYILGLKIDGKSYTTDIRAKVGQLDEEVTSPRETNEEPVS